MFEIANKRARDVSRVEFESDLNAQRGQLANPSPLSDDSELYLDLFLNDGGEWSGGKQERGRFQLETIRVLVARCCADWAPLN